MYFPHEFSWGKSGFIIDPFELMSELNGWKDYIVRSDDVANYFWLCFYKASIKEPEIKVFHEKDFTPIQYEELKKMIQEAIDNQKSKPQ
jgi:hypothetical protein